MNGVLFTNGRVDSWIANRLKRPIDWWSKQTGRDNFTLARTTAKMAPLFVCIGSLWSHHHDVIDYVIATLGVIVWTWIVTDQLRRYKIIEAMAARWMDGQMSISLEELRIIRTVVRRRTWDGLSAPFFLLFAVIPPFSLGMVIIAIAFLVISFSGYAALSFNPGGKSAWARAKDRLRAWADRVADSLSPAPVPIPVRVR